MNTFLSILAPANETGCFLNHIVFIIHESGNFFYCSSWKKKKNLTQKCFLSKDLIPSHHELHLMLNCQTLIRHNVTTTDKWIFHLGKRDLPTTWSYWPFVPGITNVIILFTSEHACGGLNYSYQEIEYNGHTKLLYY